MNENNETLSNSRSERLQKIIDINDTFNNFVILLKLGHDLNLKTLMGIQDSLKKGSDDDKVFDETMKNSLYISSDTHKEMMNAFLTCEDMENYFSIIENEKLNPGTTLEKDIRFLLEIQEKMKSIYKKLIDQDGDYKYKNSDLGVIGEIE